MTKHSRLRQWNPIGRSELLRFLAVVINIGMDDKPKIEDYWSTKAEKSSPWFGTVFSRNTFQLIFHTMLHAAAPDAEGKAKIEPFVVDLLTQYQNSFYPYEHVSIDEMVIGWKGRFAHKQYNATKPDKYHIKSFGLCDSITGYVINLLIYFGANTSYNPETDTDSSQAVRVFSKLLEPLNAKHHIYADRYYTSTPLLEYLQSKNFNYTGTININRKGFPVDIKSNK